MRKVLDVGTGVAGAVAGRVLASDPTAYVIAIDTPEVLARAAVALRAADADFQRLEFMAANLVDLNKHLAEGYADEIQCRFCLSTMSSVVSHSEEAVMRQLYRATAPGGSLVLSDYGPLNVPQTAAGSIQAELWLFDKLVSLWRWRAPLTEYPGPWARALVERVGYEVEAYSTTPAYWDGRWVDEYDRSMRVALNALPVTMQESAKGRLRALICSARGCMQRDGAIQNGYVYTLTARKP